MIIHVIKNLFSRWIFYMPHLLIFTFLQKYSISIIPKNKFKKKLLTYD